MDTSNHRPQDVLQDCRDFFPHRPDSSKTVLSRRSIDWRDSGIVIDEDYHLFQSFDTLCNFDTRSSIASDCNQSLQTSSASDNSTGCPSQKIVYDQDDDGDTLLHLAVVGFTLKRVEDLIKLCDLNAINNMMQTPLHVAVLANRPEMVDLLVRSGAKLNIHDRRGNTPLHLACQRGHVEVADIILGAIPVSGERSTSQTSLQEMIETCNFDGLTCLHLAAINNKPRIIKLLVNKYHANLNARDSKSGETIMHKVIRQYNVDLATFILNLNNQHCNDVDYSGREPLSTIEMLRGVQLTDTSQLERLLEIKALVEKGIEKCVARRGCCTGKQQNHPAGVQSLYMTTNESNSSSDYSDSDCEMN